MDLIAWIFVPVIGLIVVAFAIDNTVRHLDFDETLDLDTLEQEDD